MNKEQLKELIEKVLIGIGLYSQDAFNLVCGTIAQETHFGKYIKQVKGPALGICQIEPNTFKDIVENYLSYKGHLRKLIQETCNINEFKAESLVYNLAFSIAICRIFYLRISEPLPYTLEGYAKYYKKYYNTPLGKATEQEFINNYNKYVL